MALPLTTLPHPVPRIALPREPAASVLLGVAGGALIASREHLPRGTRNVAALAGLALIGAAAFHPLAALVRQAGMRRRSMEVRGSFVVRQPVERVFAFCRDFENFPRFIGALRSVHDYGDGRSRWSASTPAGRVIEWSAVTTKYVPNRVIAWESTSDAPVHASGLLRFRPEDGRTCLEATLIFELVALPGLSDSLAALVAPPREQQLRTDLRRMIDYLESAPDTELAMYGA